jgi:hypothetical protein
MISLSRGQTTSHLSSLSHSLPSHFPFEMLVLILIITAATLSCLCSFNVAAPMQRDEHNRERLHLPEICTSRGAGSSSLDCRAAQTSRRNDPRSYAGFSSARFGRDRAPVKGSPASFLPSDDDFERAYIPSPPRYISPRQASEPSTSVEWPYYVEREDQTTWPNYSQTQPQGPSLSDLQTHTHTQRQSQLISQGHFHGQFHGHGQSHGLLSHFTPWNRAALRDSPYRADYSGRMPQDQRDRSAQADPHQRQKGILENPHPQHLSLGPVPVSRGHSLETKNDEYTE